MTKAWAEREGDIVKFVYFIKVLGEGGIEYEFTLGRYPNIGLIQIFARAFCYSDAG